MALNSWSARSIAVRFAAPLLAGLCVLGTHSCRVSEQAKTLPPEKASSSVLLPRTAPTSYQIPIEVVETAGVDRTNWPVTAGLPLAQGALKDPSAVSLLDGAVNLPVQAGALSHWGDGSIKWLLLDFQISLAAYQTRRLTVETRARAGLPPTAVRVSETDTATEVNTGAISFTVPKAEFAPLSNLSLPRGPAAGPLKLTFQLADAEAKPKPPTIVKTNLRGPLRAEIELQGSFTVPVDYVIRIEAYAGKSFIRIYYTFINRHDQFYTRVRSLGAAIPFRALTRAFGGDGLEIMVGRAGPQGHILQKDSRLFQAGHFSGRRAAGWAEARGPQGALLLASRFFWQEYPQSISVLPSKVEYLMWDGERPLVLGTGVAKTHEFSIMLRPPASQTEDAAATAKALNTPLVARALPRYNALTQAVPNCLNPSGRIEKRVLGALEDAWERYQALADRDRWADTGTLHCSAPGPTRHGYYGMLNWGDWNFPGLMDQHEGCDGWGNLEYDLPQVLALAFLSGGPAVYRLFLDASARHFMDVDIIHHAASRPHLVGMNHPHKALHFAPDSHTTIDLGHTWTEGLLSYYLLSGDRRALEAAKGIADYLVWRGRNRKSGNPRQWGWPIIALVSVYRVTGERTYLEAAKLYASRALENIPPVPLRSDFKLGILADGLSYLHETTGDEAAAAWLKAYAAGLIEKGGGIRDIRLAPGVAYAGILTGNEDLLRSAARALRLAHPGGWGKTFAAVGRAMIRTAYLLTRSFSTSPEG